MKIFETVLTNFVILGISSDQSIRKHPFNTKILMIFVVLGLTTFLHVMHVIYVASSIKERMESITATSGSLIISICFFTIVFKMRTVFDCINSFEDIIAMSEWTISSKI